MFAAHTYSQKSEENKSQAPSADVDGADMESLQKIFAKVGIVTATVFRSILEFSFG